MGAGLDWIVARALSTGSLKPLCSPNGQTGFQDGRLGDGAVSKSDWGVSH